MFVPDSVEFCSKTLIYESEFRILCSVILVNQYDNENKKDIAYFLELKSNENDYSLKNYWVRIKVIVFG